MYEEQIIEWRKLYGDIYSVSERGKEYIFRTLTWGEFDTLSKEGKSISSAEQEDLIVKTTLLAPQEDFDSLSAGVVTSICDVVLEFSGISNPKRAKAVLDDKRTVVDSVRYLMYAFVISAMPAYKMEDLDKLNFAQLATKLALAEKILEIHKANADPQMMNVTFELTDPEEEAVKEKEAALKHGANKKPGQAGWNDPIAARLKQALG